MACLSCVWIYVHNFIAIIVDLGHNVVITKLIGNLVFLVWICNIFDANLNEPHNLVLQPIWVELCNQTIVRVFCHWAIPLQELHWIVQPEYSLNFLLSQFFAEILRSGINKMHLVSLETVYHMKFLVYIYVKNTNMLWSRIVVDEFRRKIPSD